MYFSFISHVPLIFLGACYKTLFEMQKYIYYISKNGIMLQLAILFHGYFYFRLMAMEELLNAVMKKKGRTPLDSMALRSLCVAKYPDQDGSVHITFLFYPFSVLGFFLRRKISECGWYFNHDLPSDLCSHNGEAQPTDFLPDHSLLNEIFILLNTNLEMMWSN